jgi:uncharacterized membrane protein
MIVWGLVLALHILGAVVWVGGMFFALLVLRPGLSVLAPAQRLELHAEVFRRFFRVVWHAMPIILLTGYAMLFGLYGGFAGVNWGVHVMHLLGLIMAAIFVAIVFGPYAGFRATPSAAGADAIRRLVLINLVLGLVTIAVAAISSYS